MPHKAVLGKKQKQNKKRRGVGGGIKILIKVTQLKTALYVTLSSFAQQIFNFER